MKRKDLFLMTLLSVSLNGCNSQRFDCPYKEGVRCLPLSEVDKRVSQRALPPPSPKQSGKLLSFFKRSPAKTLEPVTLPPSPLRSHAEVLTVWIAPYQSQDDTYHEEKRLHFVAQESQWLNTVSELKGTYEIEPTSTME